MSNVNAIKLIIENIQLIEQVKNLLEGELGEKFFNAVDAVIKQSVDSFDERMIAGYNFNEEVDTWFFSPKWKVGESNAPQSNQEWKNVYALYRLWNEGVNDEKNNYYLTDFLENDVDRMVFKFEIWRYNINKIPTKDWKEFVAKINQDYPQLEQLGFKFNPEGNWYLPIVSLDKQAVIENYERDTLEDALTPISDALDIIKQAHPYFDQIVQAAIAKFGRIDVDEAV
ncbi:hypothetical protein [Acinetobacter venetianus]|uniref:hypothetical protein n=1 Tax=Acinetobacter venetianus TaxID=52133 RepID=UPI003F9028B3